MKKRTNSPALESDWLLVGSRSITTSGIDAPPGPISGPIGPCPGIPDALGDYSDENAWSKRIEAEAWIHDLLSEVPDDEEE